MFAGLIAPVGPVGPPTRVRGLVIDKPGVYENYLVDAEFAGQDAVRIKANNVVLRNLEVAVPEPASLSVLLLGAAGLLGRRRRQRA